MAHTKGWAIALIILTTILTSAAQLFYKEGAGRLPEIITNWPLGAGILCYGIGALLFLVSISGGEMTVIYPLLATSYIWVTIAAFFIFNESPTPLRIAGLALIVIGVSAIGLGGRDKKSATAEVLP